MRKTNLARLLARRVDGIHLAPFEQGEIGPDLFRHACLIGLEGLVSKHRESPYACPRKSTLAGIWSASLLLEFRSTKKERNRPFFGRTLKTDSCR